MAVSGSRSPWVVTIAVAAVLGLVLALLSAVAGDSSPSPAARGPGAEPVVVPVEPEVHAPPRDMHAVREKARRDTPLAVRFDSDDADIRHAAAYELLARGPEALSQVTALRPQGAEAREMRRDLELALKEWDAIVRSPRYAQLEEVSRLHAKLQAFERVLPSEWTRDERLAYWTARVERDAESAAASAAAGRSVPEGRHALARLELELVRYELGEITHAELLTARRAHEGPARAWVDAQQRDDGVTPARKRRYAEQLARVLR